MHGASPLARKITVTASYVICLLGSMIGVGVFGGTPIEQAAGGLLSTDATLMAPGTGAFAIWSVVYAGLGAYTVWQWWDDDRRRIGRLVASSMLLNAAWILVIQAGWVWLSVAVIVALLGVLATVFRRLVARRPASTLESVIADGTMGLYLGWVSVATAANVAAALVGSGFDGFGRPELWAVAVLAVAAGIGVALAVTGRGRLAVAASLVWGLAWIAAERATGTLTSTTTALAAFAAAVAILVATVGIRARVTFRERADSRHPA